MNLYSALHDALYFFTHNLGAILRLCLPLIVLEAAVGMQLERFGNEDSVTLLKMLCGLLFYPLYSAALILYVAARSQGTQPHTRDLLGVSLRMWPSFALLTGLSSAAVLLGASIMVLPGIWLLIRLAFAEYLLVLEHLPPLEAIKRSYQLTSGHFSTLLGWIVLIMLPIWLYDLWWSSQAALHDSALLSLLLSCTSQVLQLFSTVLLFRLFMQRTALPQAPTKP